MSPGLKWSPSIHMFSKHEKAKFDGHKKVINSPPGYQNIRVHLIFAVKYDGRHKARLVADGHMPPDFVESIYSGLVSLRNLRLVMLILKLSQRKSCILLQDQNLKI